MSGKEAAVKPKAKPRAVEVVQPLGIRYVPVGEKNSVHRECGEVISDLRDKDLAAYLDREAVKKSGE